MAFVDFLISEPVFNGVSSLGNMGMTGVQVDVDTIATKFGPGCDLLDTVVRFGQYDIHSRIFWGVGSLVADT